MHHAAIFFQHFGDGLVFGIMVFVARLGFGQCALGGLQFKSQLFRGVAHDFFIRLHTERFQCAQNYFADGNRIYLRMVASFSSGEQHSINRWAKLRR